MKKIKKHINDTKKTFLGIRWALIFMFKKCPQYVLYRTIMSIFGSMIGIFDIYMIRFAINALHSGANFEQAIGYLVALIISYVLYSLIYGFVSVRAKPHFECVLKKGIKKDIYKKTVECDYSSYEDPKFFERYILAATNASNTLEDVLYTSIDLCDNLLELFFAGTLALVIDEITIIFALLPFILVPIYAKSSKLRHQMKIKLNTETRKADYVRTVFFKRDYAKEIRTTNISIPLIEMFKDALKETKKIYKESGSRRALVNVAENILNVTLSQYLILGYLAYSVLISRTMLFGDCIVLVGIVEAIFFAIDQINVDCKDLHTVMLNVEAIIDFLDTKPTIKSTSGVNASAGDIEFRNVSFKYSGMNTYALKNVTFSIKKGDRVAVVGENGAGKSTLVKLLLRLYDPSEGKITINNNDIKEYSLNTYRKLFAEVFQDFHLFSFSIKENLQMGDKIPLQVIKKALKETGLDHIVNAFPQKEDTTVGKEYDANGIVFSGGQKQQLAIAAAYCKDAEIYLFDEPSAALDPEAEARMFDNLFKISKDKTVIYISHRLSSTKAADKILYLKSGELHECGTHNELMEKNGEYANLFRMQATNYI